MENNRRGSEIFLGVIGVATLVVAIIGATFAFFSASTNSAVNAVNVSSTTLGLGYDDTTGTLLKTNLIPAIPRIATYAALDQDGSNNTNEQCVDDNGNSVCSVYQFTVTNTSTTTTQDVTFSIDVALNGFVNLKYKIYEGTASTLTAGAVSGNPAESTVKDSGTFPSVASGATHQTVDLSGLNKTLGKASPSNAVTYTMVIWLDETNHDQSAGSNPTSPNTNEAGQSFAAQMKVTSGSGAGVTGVISAAGVSANSSAA